MAKSTREPTSEDLEGMKASLLKPIRSREDGQTPDSDNSDDSDSPLTSSSKEAPAQDSDNTDESWEYQRLIKPQINEFKWTKVILIFSVEQFVLDNRIVLFFFSWIIFLYNLYDFFFQFIAVVFEVGLFRGIALRNIKLYLTSQYYHFNDEKLPN